MNCVMCGVDVDNQKKHKIFGNKYVCKNCYDHNEFYACGKCDCATPRKWWEEIYDEDTDEYTGKYIGIMGALKSGKLFSIMTYQQEDIDQETHEPGTWEYFCIETTDSSIKSLIKNPKLSYPCLYI